MYAADQDGKSITFQRAYAALATCISCLLLLTVLSMFIAYMARIKEKLGKERVENKEILDSMEDGIIIVRQADMLPCFASRAAIKLFWH